MIFKGKAGKPAPTASPQPHPTEGPEMTTEQAATTKPTPATKEPGAGFWAGTLAVWGHLTGGTMFATVFGLVAVGMSFQGMYGVSITALGLVPLEALILAGFLEGALITFARLEHNAIAAGRSGRTEAVWTWIASFASGAFSALNALIGPADFTGAHHLVLDDPLRWLAVGLRLAAPLVACVMWKLRLRSIQADRAGTPSHADALRRRRMLAVALPVLNVAQVVPSTKSKHWFIKWPAKFIVARARRRSHRAYTRMLHHYGATTPDTLPELTATVEAVAMVNALPDLILNPAKSTVTTEIKHPAPAITAPTPTPTPAIEPPHLAESELPGHRAKATTAAATMPLRDAVNVRVAELRQGTPSDDVSTPTTKASPGIESADTTPTNTTPLTESEQRLAVALELLRKDPDTPWQTIAQTLEASGISCARRTAFDVRNKALAQLRQESHPAQAASA